MKADIEQLQGTWNVIDLEVEGQKIPADVFAGSKIVIAGNAFTTVGMGATYEGTLDLDTGSRPKSVDMVFSEGPERGNTSFGIYELEEDSWKLCLTVSNTARPKAFATMPGSGHAFEILRRNK